MIPERFGPYLLLKKLAEDPLGEVFRAGRVGPEGLERVALLRALNGSAVDGRALASAIAGRGEVQAALRNPNIGSGIDLGEVQGIPFVAYDYVSGKNLGVVLDQIVKRSYPMPADHALLLAERLSLGLAVAHETRVGDERSLHGFLVPHLVMLSSEGETRILGFEVGLGLRRQLDAQTSLRAEFGRYLSPEAQRGAAPSVGDDIYALGAILLELLLGHPLPHPMSEDYRPGFGGQVEHVVKHGPKGIGDLLAQTLAPAGERIADVVTWHKTLSRLMVEGGHKSTTFNLAFFMHSLFRDDIERESEELEAEKSMDLAELRRLQPTTLAHSSPVAAAPIETSRTSQAPTTAPAGPAPVTLAKTDDDRLVVDGTLGSLDEVLRPLPEQPDPPQARVPDPTETVRGRSRRRVLGPTLALALVLLGAAGKWLWDEWQARQATPVESPPPPSESAPAAVPATVPDLRDELEPIAEDRTPIEPAVPPDEPDGPDPEELLARLDRMVDERTRAVEATLRSEYDREIAELRSQLEAARQQGRQEAATASPPPRSQESVARSATDPQPRTGSVATTGREPARGTSREEPAAQTRPAVPAPGPSRDAAPDPPVLEAPLPTAPTPTTSRIDRPLAGAQEDTGPREASANEQRVRLGELVEEGPGVVPPQTERCPQVAFPALAERLGRTASVIVELLVDEEGRVKDTRLPERHGFGFDEAALRAARNCRFTPATKRGVRVQMWTRLSFEFRR